MISLRRDVDLHVLVLPVAVGAEDLGRLDALAFAAQHLAAVIEQTFDAGKP